MFAFLSMKLVEKYFPYMASCMARRREARYAEREARRRQARYARPRLEGLEERVVPAIDTFTGPAGGAWVDAVNWDLGTVPGSTDTAIIPAGKYCTLNDLAQQTVAGLTVAGRLDIGSKLSVTTLNTTGTFNVVTSGEVDVLGSGDLGGGGTINGQIDAQGGSVTFDPGSSMVLGNGATLTGSLFNVFGDVTVTGALSQEATMVLSANGYTTSGSLTGPGSMTDSGEFDWDGGIIGLTGSGGADFIADADLKIQGGAYPEFLSAGTLTNQCNSSEIGGTGVLYIEPGATFDNLGNPSCDVTIPTISVLPGGSFINDGDGFFDAKGTTTISGNFTNLGTLEVGTGSTLTITNPGGGTGDVVDLNGTVQLDGDLTLLGAISSSDGFIQEAGGGTLKVGDGSTASSLTLASGTSTVLSGNVEVTRTGTLTGAGFLNNSGVLTLDLGSTATIGSYQQTSIGTLEEHASGNGVNSTLTVSGDAQLSGTLKMDFDDGYTPKPGDSFLVLTAGAVEDHFDTTPDNMTVTYGPTSVGLTEN